MSQATGFPGGGIRLTNSVMILCGQGAPSASTTPDVQSAGPGSLFLRQDVAQIYLCTAGPPWANGVLLTASTWTQITFP
jgi:hypothetical protein